MISQYILLRLKEDAEKSVIKCWLDTVKDDAPPGVFSTLQVADDDNMPHSIRLIKRQKKDCMEYIVPLARNLTGKEIAKIVMSFADKQPDLDFDIETDESCLMMNNIAKIDSKGFENLGIDLAKQEHSDWLKDRTNAGWCYGVKFSNTNKTHPLLLPWEQLPDAVKKPNMTLPQKVVDFLNAQGYAIIPKDELAKIINMID